MSNDYRDIVHRHYADEAAKEQLSPACTMHDLNVRRMEIKCHLRYLQDGFDCLEVGCGNGAASEEICKAREINLLAVDVTKEMIALAKKRALEGIKGKLEFRKQDVLELDYPPKFDVVYTTRCIINLLDWNDQKKALSNMASAVKKNGGMMVLIEAFTDGLSELNQARSEFALEPIKAAYHNLHLDREKVIQHLSKDMKFVKDDNFLSSYYFWTRIFYPALARANNVKLVKNSKFDSFFGQFTPVGNFAHIKALVFRKN